MEQDGALELVNRGATLLFLDVPQHTLVGVDTQMYSVGPLFKGIKMIPPGVHFVYYSAANREGNTFSPFIGFFITLSQAEVLVRKWDQREEKLVKLPEEEEERYLKAVKNLEFDRQLGPYALDKMGGWKQISNYITKDTIERIEPLRGEITIAFESGGDESIPKTLFEKNLADQLKMCNNVGSADKHQRIGCYYTPIPNLIKRKGISGEQLTAMNIDKTDLLESILVRNFRGSDDLLLGELQFAFIAFLMGQSLEAFYQWKALVSLLLSCTRAPLHTRTRLFVKFIRVIYYQLKHGCNNDKANSNSGVSFFTDNSLVSKGSFLHHTCKAFFCLIEESGAVDGDLLSWSRKLRRFLECTFGWDFHGNVADAADDEFSPVVVASSDLGLPENQLA